MHDVRLFTASVERRTGACVEEHPDGRRGRVVELAGPHRPHERGQEAAGDEPAGDDEQDDHAHGRIPRGARTRIRPALRPTIVSELTGISMAVASGVSRPASASVEPDRVVEDRDGEAERRSTCRARRA